MSPPLVLITGVTGFLAQHVVAATLNAGFRVRGTMRSESKANGLLKKFPKNFETTMVQDIATSDLADAVKGVTYVLHTASPYKFAVTNGKEELLKPAIDGTLNVLRAARNVDAKKVVVTSSFGAMWNAPAGGPWRDYEYTENDWNPSTYEEAAKDGADPVTVYAAGKKLAEQAAWNFAKENDMALVALNPSMIYGPALQDAATSPASLNTSASMIYQLISGKLNTIPDDLLPQFVDARDVAKAHVLALQKDSASGARIPLCGGGFTWAQAVEELYATRPELRSRLVPRGTGNAAPSIMSTISTRVAAEKLGLKEFIGWKQSLSDTVDSLLELEKKWHA